MEQMGLCSTFTFSQPIQFFGAYITGAQHGCDPVFVETMTFSDGETQTVFIPNEDTWGGAAFVGFTDAGKEINTVTLCFEDDSVCIDDVRFGSVPEPSTFVLLGMAAFSLIAYAWRRRK